MCAFKSSISFEVEEDSPESHWAHKDSQDECYGCYAPLPDKEYRRYAFLDIRTDKNGNKHITAHESCAVCADADEAMINAKSEGRKFTLVGVNNILGGYSYRYNEFNPKIGGSRCICGSASIRKNDDRFSDSFCIQCSIANRMLNKQQANLRLLSKAMVELRREIRNKKKSLEV